jgi:hypothetical protein
LRVAPARPRDSDVLSDIRQTYAWLAQHVSEAKPFLIARRQEKLWLNVDDPATEEWQWHTASQLLFDFDDEGDWREVREFLSAYPALLVEAGAQKIDRPAKPVVALTPAEKQLETTRTVADSLRADRKLTDVVLVANDGQEFHAHRFFLVTATESEYMRDAFLNPTRFAESSEDISTRNPLRLTVDHSPAAVGACLSTSSYFTDRGVRWLTRFPRLHLPGCLPERARHGRARQRDEALALLEHDRPLQQNATAVGCQLRHSVHLRVSSVIVSSHTRPPVLTIVNSA